MENATEAIKMAGAVLMFVMALSITILTFGQARESSDIILNYKDRETEYQYVEPQGTERTVNLETIIPAIFRAYLENYKIVFAGKGFDPNDPNAKPIYSIKENLPPPNDKTPRYSIDLDSVQTRLGIASDEDAKKTFISAILYGVSSPNEKKTIENRFRIELPDEPLYNRLIAATQGGHEITEALGVYYEDANPNIPDVMKTEKRIITYRIR